jgi:hypothetical protein
LALSSSRIETFPVCRGAASDATLQASSSRRYFDVGISAAAVCATLAASSPDFFETKIRPILANNCYSCHTDSKLSGLRVDSSEALLKGGDRGPAIVPGDPDKSLLISAVRQTDPDLKMPMGGKLKDAEVADLAAWVKAVRTGRCCRPISATATRNT